MYRTNKFYFTTLTLVFVRFLEEIEDTKKAFRNYLTFNISISFHFLEYAKYSNQPSNDYGDYNPKQAAPLSSGLGSLLSFHGILSSILVLVGLTLFAQTFEKIWPLITGKKPTEEEMRMFKGIEDSAIANIMSSIEEFKTKYFN